MPPNTLPGKNAPLVPRSPLPHEVHTRGLAPRPASPNGIPAPPPTAQRMLAHAHMPGSGAPPVYRPNNALPRARAAQMSPHPHPGAPPVYRPAAHAVQSRQTTLLVGQDSPPTSRRTVESAKAIQPYKVLSGNRILNAMPTYKQKPWFGYPYVVVHGATFAAQQPGANAAPVDFLTVPGGNVANVVNHAGALSLRVSDDNNIAIEDSNLVQRQPKEFYATRQTVLDANRELRRLNSGVRLILGASHLSILEGWTATTELHRVTPQYNGGSADNAPQNCDEMAAVVVGTDSAGLVHNATGQASTSAWRIGGVSEERYRTLYNDRRITTEQLENYQARQYVNNRDAREVRRRQVNEYARPGVGGAFMIATVGHGTDQGGGVVRLRDVASGQDRDMS